MANLKTLGPKTALLVTGLNDRGKTIFDTETAADLMGVSKAHAAVLLHAAIKRGLLTPIKRGLYNLIPFELGTTSYHLDDRYLLVHASFTGKPYFLSHASAMDLHRLATQPNFDVYATAPNRLASSNLGGTPVHFVKSTQARFFGYENHDLGSGRVVSVSDIERALLDGLAMPNYCGGFVDVAKAFFMAKGRFNPEKLAAYARRYGKGAVIRRLGFLLETLGLAGKTLINALQTEVSAGAVKLDPGSPLLGPHIAKWGLRQNITTDEILQAVRT